MIEIENKDYTFPFSKGILAQSIQPTGLPIDDIYKIVREVEDALKSEKTPVPAHDVHKKVVQVLSKKGLEKEIRRYKISRKIALIDKPLVILIGGTSGIGKSSIAAALTRRLGIERVIGTDEIREVMRYTLPEDLLPALHKSSFEAGETLAGPDIKENVLVGFTRQASIVNSGVRAYIKRTEKEGLKAIFDGVHLVPGMLGIDEENSSVMIFHYLLTLSDKEEHIRRFHYRKEGNLRNPKRYIQKIDRIRSIQKYAITQVKETDAKKIENLNKGQTVTEIVDDLIEKLPIQISENYDE